MATTPNVEMQRAYRERQRLLEAERAAHGLLTGPDRMYARLFARYVVTRGARPYPHHHHRPALAGYVTEHRAWGLRERVLAALGTKGRTRP